MFGDVGGGDEEFGQGDGVVGDEEDGVDVLAVGIVVDDLGDVVDEADDELGHVVYQSVRREYQSLKGTGTRLQPGAAFPPNRTTLGTAFLRSSGLMALRVK